jgi:CHAT domain-containing protein
LAKVLYLGNYFYFLGDFVAACRTYKIVQSEYERLIVEGHSNLSPDLAGTRKNLGICFESLGIIPAARYIYETALLEYEHIVSKGNPQLEPLLAGTRMNLGNCLYSLGDLQAACRTYEICLSEYEHLIAAGREDWRTFFALTQMNLGICLYYLGNLSAARNLYESALKEYEMLIAEGYEMLPSFARVHTNLAICLEDIGDITSVKTHYDDALRILKLLQTRNKLFPDAIKIIRNIADWHRHPQRPPQPDKPGAFKLAKLGLDWLDELLNRLSDAATNSMLTKNLPLFQLATELALELNQPEQAYLILERSKSRVLVEQMLRERAEPSSQVDENLRTQYRELRERLRSLVNQLNISTPTSTTDNEGSTRFFTSTTRSIEHRPEQTEQLWQQQQAVEQELDKVRRAITEQDAAFGEAIQPRPLTVEEVIALIPADTLVIAFEQGPKILRLYAITAQGIPTPLQIDLSSQQVYEQAKIFQDNMRDENMSHLRKTVDKLCKGLNSQLKQLLTELTAQFQPQHIILIPHVDWHLLPIHLVTIDNEPLAVRYPVHYLPSIQILRLIRERLAAKQDKGCIIANPWSEALKKLIGEQAELKSGEQEGYKVYELRAQVDILLAREQATSTAVRQALDRAQHCHFSCHGHFDADLTKAGLTLADCKDLVAIEMFTSIRLDNPRLVVMSACETAQIQPTLADEYMGLSSSFLFAGAHNVLATQWPVDDNASRLLIENFYQSLNDGLSAVKALQQAQYQLRNLTIADIKARFPDQRITRSYNHPYYWAGFVLIGDGE